MKERGTLVVAVLVALVAVCNVVMEFPRDLMASTVDLPRTGQTRCYDDSGAEVSCPGTGQDGYFKAGIGWPNPRFTDNGDGTVRDNLTGLVWLKNANCFGTKPWSDAFGSTGNLAEGQCGLTDGSAEGDWRVPNINELESLVHAGYAEESCGDSLCGAVGSWLLANGFSDVQGGYYWSSTSNGAMPSFYAWAVHTGNGRVDNGSKSGDSYYVLPVRGTSTPPARIWKTGQTISYATGDDGELQEGVSWPNPRFADGGDGTVTDHLTGLTWLKNGDCAGDTRDWATALSDVASLNADGTINGHDCGDTSNNGTHQSDWRLPNRRELRSLIDFSRYSPPIEQGHPFTNVRSGAYWSATSVSGSPELAWFNDMWDGYAMHEGKMTAFGYVWPVRGGAFELNVSKSGTGTGDVTSDLEGISCGTDCSQGYAPGTSVTLSAKADAGSLFEGWSGDCTGTAPTAQVTMDSAKSCTAIFAAQQPSGTYTLMVEKAGLGSGTVTSVPGGISCGVDCTEWFTKDTKVALTASPEAGSIFAGWSGDCIGKKPIKKVKMKSDKSCTANFALGPDLVVTLVSVSPGSIQAGEKVTVTYEVTNQGDYTTGKASRVSLVLSSDSTIELADMLLGSQRIPKLAPGAGLTRTKSVRTGSGVAPGDYFLGVMADSSNAIQERDEANNTDGAPLSVQ